MHLRNHSFGRRATSESKKDKLKSADGRNCEGDALRSWSLLGDFGQGCRFGGGAIHYCVWGHILEIQSSIYQ